MATTKKPEKFTRTEVDTVLVTPETAKRWKSPPFQRPVVTNFRVVDLSEEMKQNGGIFPGIITLGILEGVTYLVDGQHRLAAFILSELKEGYTDIRSCHFDTLGDMADEYVRLNSQLQKMKPDDLLRGLESSCPALETIKKSCPFVGYDNIRRSEHSPILSMNQVVRCWYASNTEVPKGGNQPASQIAREMTFDDAVSLVEFLRIAFSAWGRDDVYKRLWGSLNLTLCMWIYRRTVLVQWSTRVPKISKEIFVKLLMSLSADPTYCDWLVGRNIGERERSPAYRRIKSCFVARLQEMTGKKISFPQPAWAHKG